MTNEDRRAEAAAGRKAGLAALRLAFIYAAAAASWIVLSDRAVAGLTMPTDVADAVSIGKGLLFVAVTSTVLYVTAGRFLRVSYLDQDRYRRAQEALHDRELSIRQAYIDVLDAVTGGSLILMWPDDLQASLGEVVVPVTPISRPDELAATRHRLTEVLARFADGVDEEVLATGEALTNALRHGGHGEYSVRRTADRVQVVVTDFGPGIDFQTLPKATLVPGFSTKPSLGLGFTIMLDVAKRLLLATEPGLTTLVLEFDLGHRPRNPALSTCGSGAGACR